MDVDEQDVAEISVVCAWCGRLIREGQNGAEVSHGLCEECAAGDPLEVKQRGEDDPAERLSAQVAHHATPA